ncbi:hypothetical protein BH10CYA1_BH10CYA1_42270 [soil metagenome]
MKRLLPTLLIMSAFSLPMAQAQSANDYNERATTLAKKGDYAGALKNYDNAIKSAPTEYASYLNRAEIYKVLKKNELAMADLNRAVKISGNDPQVIYERGKLYYDLKNYSLALADVNRSIQADPNVADRYATRAAIYQGMKQYNKAIVDCTKFLSTNPRAGQIYDARGSAFLGLGQLDKAIADYSAAVACSNKDAFALAMRGSIYQKQKKYDLALADLNRVIVEVPDSPSKTGYYKERLKLYDLMHEKNEDLISGDLERIAVLEPKNSALRYRFAVMAWRKQPDLAIRDLTEAVALEPTNVKYLALLGRVQSETGQTKAAVENLTKALVIDANNADSYTARARSYLADYKFAEALADADKAIALDPKATEVFYFKGTALEGLRNSKGAVEAYGRFARLKAQEPNRNNEDDRRIEQSKRKVELLTKNLSEEEKAGLNVPELAPPSPAPSAPPAMPEKTPATAAPAK